MKIKAWLNAHGIAKHENPGDAKTDQLAQQLSFD